MSDEKMRVKDHWLDTYPDDISNRMVKDLNREYFRKHFIGDPLPQCDDDKHIFYKVYGFQKGKLCEICGFPKHLLKEDV